MWDIYLDKVLNKSSLYVRDDSILVLQKYLAANARTAELHHNAHGHARFGSHQVQPLHSILAAVPRPAVGQD